MSAADSIGTVAMLCVLAAVLIMLIVLYIFGHDVPLEGPMYYVVRETRQIRIQADTPAEAATKAQEKFIAGQIYPPEDYGIKSVGLSVTEDRLRRIES